MEVLAMVKQFQKEIKNRGLCYLELVNFQKLMEKANKNQIEYILKNLRHVSIGSFNPSIIDEVGFFDQKSNIQTKKGEIYD